MSQLDASTPVPLPTGPFQSNCFKTLVLGAEGSGKTGFIQSWTAYCLKKLAVGNQQELIFDTPNNGSATTNLTELHGNPYQSNAERLAHEGPCVIFLVCDTSHSSLNQIQFVSFLGGLKPSKQLAVFIIVRASPTSEASSSSGRDRGAEILSWATQLSVCSGLYQYSSPPTDHEMEETWDALQSFLQQPDLFKPTQSSANDAAVSHGLSESPSTDSLEILSPRSEVNTLARRRKANARDTPPQFLAANATITSSDTDNTEGPGVTSTNSHSQPGLAKTSSRPSAACEINPAKGGWSSGLVPSSIQLRNSAPVSLSSTTMSSSQPSSTVSPPLSPTSSTSSLSQKSSSSSSSSSSNTSPVSMPSSQIIVTSSTPQHGQSSQSSSNRSHNPNRVLQHTVSSPANIVRNMLSHVKKKKDIPDLPNIQLEELQPKQLQKLPSTSIVMVSTDIEDRSSTKWLTQPLKMRIVHTDTNTYFAFYTVENVNSNIQTTELVVKSKLYNKSAVTPTIYISTDSANSNFFKVSELRGIRILISTNDPSSLSSYLKSSFPSIIFENMKPSNYMSLLMQCWAESEENGIPAEAKRAVDVACLDKSSSKYMLESLELSDTPGQSIPRLVRACVWFPYLSVLSFKECGISDEDGADIIQAVTLNPYVKSLELSGNELGQASTNALSLLLARPSRRLMILDLSDNPFSSKSIISILEYLSNNSSIKIFSMTGVAINSKPSVLALTQLLTKNNWLVSLKLSVDPNLGEPIFHAMMNNITLAKLDLGWSNELDMKSNIDKIAERNSRGPSSTSLAGWVSDWPKLLEIVPTKSESLQQMEKATSKAGMSWKNVASFTSTFSEGPIGKLSISSDGIHFAVTSPTNIPANDRDFPWTPSLKAGQLTTDPVAIVIYDPTNQPDPFVFSLPKVSQLLEVIICLNAAMEFGQSKIVSSRGRAKAIVGAEPSNIAFLDTSRITIGEQIAPVGGSGTEVKHAQLGGFNCCVKILDCSQYGQDAIGEMEREISLLMMSQKSNHIVNYLYHDKSGHHMRLFMELFPSSLRKTIKARAATQSYFTAQQVYKLAKKILKGLKFLHTQPTPIVHRDIKTDNVLIEEDVWGNFSRVKLTDFGSAKILTRGRTGSIDQGTSGYQAPEMVKGATEGELSYTTAVDIFSFGITLYEILALQKVYPHCKSRQEVEDALKNAEKYPPDFLVVPRHLLHFLLIVSPCLKRNYTERPTAEQLLENLEQMAVEIKVKS